MVYSPQPLESVPLSWRRSSGGMSTRPAESSTFIVNSCAGRSSRRKHVAACARCRCRRSRSRRSSGYQIPAARCFSLRRAAATSTCTNFRARAWRPAQLAAGIEPIRRPYDLRHTYATFALRAGVSIFDLSRFMGASLAMIDRHYGHLARDGRQHAIMGGHASTRSCWESAGLRTPAVYARTRQCSV